MMPLVPPPPAHEHRLNQSRVSLLYAIVIGVGTTYPGSVIGALVAGAVIRRAKAGVPVRLLAAALGLACAAALRTLLVVAWVWRLCLSSVVPAWAPNLSVGVVLQTLAVEALLGPALLVIVQLANVFRSKTPVGLERQRYENAMTRRRALQPGWTPSGAADAAGRIDMRHPDNAIRLGTDAERGTAFDLGMDEVLQHVFVPGASGTGKTTTLVRLADGALANGFGVVIVDCKGVGLGGEALRLAQRWGLPFAIVDPDDSRTLGYDVCTGDPAAVANKIIGAFQFSGEAEIYKQVAMEVVPIMCRALHAAQRPVTLNALYDALGKGGLSELGRLHGADRYRDRLEELESSGGLGTAGYAGLQRRLGALMQGKFGDIFEQRPALDWDAVTGTPHVTYLSLSSTATGEDVELFGHVIAQDLKQLCDRRMRAIDGGGDPAPVLIVFDEFAALREATQIVDLLLQARQARAPIVVATQYLPDEVSIRKPVLSAGVIIAHRLGHDDSEQIAKELGTHKVPFTTAQVNYETGMSEKGSVRMVDEFNVHPNVLRTLPTGTAAVYARRTERRAVVHVHRNTT